ncbi:efflux RND transporter periplasmic adaptor subunit [Sinimarinibacterium thermocellulolyticum]|uniref:HlyD family efflux transporter periplasmic adaptor subunit n=1 Tax=Sinimarinibacterium thermocellulolyticum TaxID=3170016 RepID=A0ABV2A7V1_9GAMM
MSDTENATASTSRRAQWRAIGAVVLLCALAGAAALAWWGLVLSKRVTTDNAQIANSQIPVMAQVPGTVATVHVADTQRVNKGDVLLELNTVDAQAALDQSRAALVRAISEVVNLRARAAQAQAAVASHEVALENAERDYRARMPLKGSGALAPELLRHASAQVTLARAELLAAKEQAKAAAVLAGASDIALHPLVRTARADHLKAWLALGRTRIHAPLSGTVAQRVVDAGEQVAPGVQLMRIIPASGFWVDANLKETQLRHVRVGQPVTVTLDLYGRSRELPGRVAGISAGTGATFSLLPPQNAAGNWVKVVQRVPVRIELDESAQSDERYPLFVGLSAHVRIDTRDRSGPKLRPVSASGPERTSLDQETVLADRHDQLSASRAAAEFRQTLLEVVGSHAPDAP